MAFESSFNKDLARKMASSQDVETLLDQELILYKKRALELNAARKVMAEGYEKVLKGLQMAYPNLDLEDKNLVDKWSNILEEYINNDVSTKVKNIIENALSSCYNKSLHRTYQMKKILPDNDESL